MFSKIKTRLQLFKKKKATDKTDAQYNFQNTQLSIKLIATTDSVVK